jgi:hypothetical protein
MTDNPIESAFRRMKWLKLNQSSPEIHCEICKASITVVPEGEMTKPIDRLFKFTEAHAECGKGKKE